MSNQEPIEIITTSEQRQADVLLMRKHNKNQFFPTEMYKVKDVIAEMNLRLSQYKAWGYSFEFRILQSVQDFQNMVTPLQRFKNKQRMHDRLGKAKVDFTSPVAQLDKKMIYAKNEDGFEVFTFVKP